MSDDLNDLRDAYSQLTDNYGQGQLPDHGTGAVRKFVRALDGPAVLDAGCAGGVYSRLFSLLDLRVFSLDASRALLQEGSRNVRRPVQGDIRRLPYANETFDGIWCQAVLVHVADPEGPLRELGRVLRPGGVLALSFKNTSARTPDYDKGRRMYYHDSGSVRSILEEMGFAISVFKTIDDAERPISWTVIQAQK